MKTFEFCQFVPSKLYSIAPDPAVADTVIVPFWVPQSVGSVFEVPVIVGCASGEMVTVGYVLSQPPTEFFTLIVYDPAGKPLKTLLFWYETPLFIEYWIGGMPPEAAIVMLASVVPQLESWVGVTFVIAGAEAELSTTGFPA